MEPPTPSPLCTPAPFRRRAFTLLEILVSVAVCTFLLVLAVGVANFAVASSRGALCAAKLRQIGTVVQNIAADSGGNFLLYEYFPATETTKASATLWGKQMQDYGLDWDDMRCPAKPETGKSHYILYGMRGSAETSSDDMIRGYIGTATGGANWLKLWQIKEPGKYTLFTDSIHPLGENATYAGRQHYQFRFDPLKNGGPGIQPRHNGKANILFADGHIEAVTKHALPDVGFLSGYTMDVKCVKW